MSHVIIQCGSSARGDSNANSDIDLVCIWSEKAPDYDLISKQYAGIVFYSQETIRRMKNKGSLFLTHIDIDGIFLCGDRALLDDLKGFRPSPYKVLQNYTETVSFIDSLNWYPDSTVGQAWLCDILYVALRNCIYCKNAANEIYAFGFLNAISRYGLPDAQIDTMLAIRKIKYLYRACSSDSISDTPLIFEKSAIELACQEIIEHPVRFTTGGSTDWRAIEPGNYWSERLIERAILNGEYQNRTFLESLKKHNYQKVKLQAETHKILKALRQ